MPTSKDFMDAAYLEAAANELRQEVERIQARAASLKQRTGTEAGIPEMGFIKCSNICGQCCFCSIC